MSTWTAPKFWTAGEMATTTLLRIHITHNLRFIGDGHAHGSTGSVGAGSLALGPVIRVALSTAANPGTAGRLVRVGNDLKWGASNIVVTNLAAASTVAGLLMLGASSTAAARGTHTH